MFLKRMFFVRGQAERCQAERGSALLAVVGLLGVTGVIALTITTVSLYAVGYTSSTRAGVQAQAAAAAGIDYAAANFSTSVCQGQYSSTSAPLFTVTVASSTLQTSPGDTDTSWVSGCPTSTDIKRLKFVSTGTASALGVAGNSSGNVRRVEAIYPYTPTAPTYGVVASGAAVYAFAQTDSTVTNLTINKASTVQPSIQYLSGNVSCLPNTTINGDVVLGQGSISSDCTINGDLSASGTVNIQSGEITGNVNAAGVVGGTSVSLSKSAKIDGNVYAAGPVSIDGTVGGNLVAGPTVGTSYFGGGASVGGSVITAGTVSAPAGVIKGTVSMNQSGIVTPTMPLVPEWVDYAYSFDGWKTDSGAPYTLFTLPDCNATTLRNTLNAAQGSSTPTIVDTRTCGGTTNVATTTITGNLTLKSDMVILGNGFSLGSNNFESSNTSDRRLWIIIPDTLADSKPTCPVSSTATMKQGVMVGSHVAALFYSPCLIDVKNDVWRGQLYATSVKNSAAFTLNYLPIGLPGVNLSTGQKTPTSMPGSGMLKPRTSIRDLTVG